MVNYDKRNSRTLDHSYLAEYGQRDRQILRLYDEMCG
jgi:hypothetical protein